MVGLLDTFSFSRDIKVKRSRDLEVKRPRNLEIWRSRDLEVKRSISRGQKILTSINPEVQR